MQITFCKLILEKVYVEMGLGKKLKGFWKKTDLEIRQKMLPVSTKLLKGICEWVHFSWAWSFLTAVILVTSLEINPLMPGGVKRSYILKQTMQMMPTARNSFNQDHLWRSATRLSPGVFRMSMWVAKRIAFFLFSKIMEKNYLHNRIKLNKLITFQTMIMFSCHGVCVSLESINSNRFWIRLITMLIAVLTVYR